MCIRDSPFTGWSTDGHKNLILQHRSTISEADVGTPRKIFAPINTILIISQRIITFLRQCNQMFVIKNNNYWFILAFGKSCFHPPPFLPNSSLEFLLPQPFPPLQIQDLYLLKSILGLAFLLQFFFLLSRGLRPVTLRGRNLVHIPPLPRFTSAS